MIEMRGELTYNGCDRSDRVNTVKITLSANAGIAVDTGGKRIWIDALHEDRQPGFSALTQPLQKQMLRNEAFFDPDFICYTHCHPDHYSRWLTELAKKMWPRAKLLLPEPEFDGQILVTGERYEVEDEKLRLRFIRLPHEGAQYANVKHYGLILTVGGKNILVAGDCATASPELAKAVTDTPIDLAILNFPWITLAKGREFVQNILKPRHVLVCHLPFAEDDNAGYRRSAEKSARTLRETMDIRLLWEPWQEETVLL